MTDASWWQLLLALGYGVLGSILPVFNAEAFIIAALATQQIGPIEMGVFLGLGYAVGKMIIFQAIRQGRRLPLPRRGDPANLPPPGKWRKRWARLVSWGIRLVEHPRWGPLGYFTAASVSLPPSYATAILAPATRANFALFSVFTSLGFILRYVVICLALSGVLDIFF